MYSFGGVDGVDQFEQHVLSKGPHILFIRGFCPPEWLERINAKIPIDPELCQRHLHLDPTDVVKNNLFTSPQLPSASVNTLQLPFTTTCSRVKDVQGGENLKHDRLNASKKMAAYHDFLPIITPMGDSIVRKYDLLSRSDFVVEQTVTACVSVTADSWTVVVWLDNGRDLGRSTAGPWTPPPGAKSWEHYFRPVIQHRQWLPFLPIRDVSNHLSDSPTSWEANQNACAIPFNYGLALNPETMRSDAVYALSDIFRFSAHSENQFLNMVKLHISREATAETASRHALDNLRYTKSLIDHHCIGIKQIARLLRSRDLLEWPMAQDETQRRIATKEVSLLCMDFEHLEDRAGSLSAACDQGMTSLVNHSVFLVSVQGLKNAVDVQRLTVLATIFIPMAFTASVFGMNFKEFGTGNLSIWIFFVTLVGVVGVAGFGFWWRPKFLQSSKSAQRPLVG